MWVIPRGLRLPFKIQKGKGSKETAAFSVPRAGAGEAEGAEVRLHKIRQGRGFYAVYTPEKAVFFTKKESVKKEAGGKSFFLIMQAKKDS